MTATRKADLIRGDQAMHGLTSWACTQLSMDPVHFTLCSVTELAVKTGIIYLGRVADYCRGSPAPNRLSLQTLYSRSLCSFAFNVIRKTSPWQRAHLTLRLTASPLLGCIIVNADLLKLRERSAREKNIT